MKHARHVGQLSRLRKIEGQVRGIVRMVEAERYCVEILTQLRAARAALRRVEDSVLREHVEHCVAQALQSGDPAEQRGKVEELLDVLARFSE
jgi:DNA-binding FrmR family transcriptional regulator